MTTSTFGAGLTTEVRDELVALALGQAADGLAGRDPALGEDPVHLHASVLRDREQEIEHLGGGDPLRRVQQEAMDLGAASFEVALEPGTLRTNLSARSERPFSGFRERSGAVPSGDFAGVWAAGGMAGDSTHGHGR